MGSDDVPKLDTEDRQRVYEYIREHGPVSPESLEDEEVVPVTPSRYWQIVAILKRDGYVEEREGKLRDAYSPAEREEHLGEELDYSVRAARLEDLSGLAGVIRQVTAGETYIVGESVEDQLAHADTLLHGAADEPPMYFVAIHDGEVVGWVNLAEPEVAKLSHAVYLTMGLLDEYRGFSIGATLMDRAVDWARRHGYDKVSANIPATNEAAVEFLEREGWRVVATRPDHYKIGGDFVDEVLLDRWT
jgi:GNAT superfamily N-acetyltransferase